jgi:protein-tyrosine phosphatase
MQAECYLIPDVPSGRLAIMPRPRAGDWLPDEIASWKRLGLEVIVSVLEDAEIIELGLEEEEALCGQAGLELLRFPIPDRGVPASREGFTALIRTLVEHLRQGRNVGIHCRVGLGRSAVVAACVLVRLGRGLDAAWASIQQARRLSVPDTIEQCEWVAWWAKSAVPRD